MKVIDQTLLEKVIVERSRHSHKGDTVVCFCWEGPILMRELSSCQPLQLLKVGQVW